MSPIRCAYVDGRWGQVHVRMAGSGAAPPLMLLHPTPKSGWIYETLMGVLGRGRAVIAPDTPGYGASAPPPEPPAIEDHAAQLLAVADALAAQGAIPSGPVDVLGYHTGSSIAVGMAGIAPERVRRLVLVSLAAYDADERATRRAGLGRWRGPQEDGSHLTAMWSLMQGLFDPRVDIAWKHASFTENLRPGARVYWGYDAVYRQDLQAALDALRHPTMILNPEDDLYAVTGRNAGRVAGARYVELAGAGHGLFEVEAERIGGLIEDFLR